MVASAVGHLLELTVPPETEVKRGKWTFAQLPVIPDHFALKPISKTESRLKLLKRLIKRKDVEEVINGCDAGREGELIFRHIISESKTKKTIRRLWLQSMTKQAIRDGFQKLRSDEAMLPIGMRGRLPLGIRLAGGYQRHTSNDRFQLEIGRLLPDYRRASPNTNTHDSSGSRTED